MPKILTVISSEEGKMKLTYDEKADAMYIYLNEKEVAKTVRVSNRVIVDLDKEGNLRGIEVL